MTGCRCVQNSPDLIKLQSSEGVVLRGRQPSTQRFVPDLVTPEAGARSNSRLSGPVNYSGIWGHERPAAKPCENIPERFSPGLWQDLSALRVRLIIRLKCDQRKECVRAQAEGMMGRKRVWPCWFSVQLNRQLFSVCVWRTSVFVSVCFIPSNNLCWVCSALYEAWKQKEFVVFSLFVQVDLSLCGFVALNKNSRCFVFLGYSHTCHDTGI